MAERIAVPAAACTRVPPGTPPELAAAEAHLPDLRALLPFLETLPKPLFLIAHSMGGTIGMMLANVPAVYLGNATVERVSMKLVRAIAAALFLLIGLWVLAQTAGWFG